MTIECSVVQCSAVQYSIQHTDPCTEVIRKDTQHTTTLNTIINTLYSNISTLHYNIKAIYNKQYNTIMYSVTHFIPHDNTQYNNTQLQYPLGSPVRTGWG